MSFSGATISGDDTGSAIATYSAWANEAARSPNLLRTIDRTVNGLASIRDVMKSIQNAMVDFLDKLPAVKEAIPEEKVIPGLEEVLDAMSALHTKMKNAKASADGDKRLHPRDGVSKAFASAIDSLCDVHESVDALRWGILHHNAALDTSGGTILRSADEIDAFFSKL